LGGQAIVAITILDRKGLETMVCECYQIVKTEFDRLLGTHHKLDLKS
jgi:hypothetical protein